MFNVALRRVRSTIVAAERQKLLPFLSVCVCSLRCPACNAHSSYCYLWPARLYIIFPHLINGTIFEKSYGILNYVLIFSALFCETFPITRRTERDMIKLYIGLHVKYPLLLSDFNET